MIITTAFILMASESTPLFASSSSSSGGCRRILVTLLLIVLLWFLVWPIAAFCAGPWILLQVFEPVLPVIADANQLLERLVTWPRTVGRAIFEGTEDFPMP